MALFADDAWQGKAHLRQPSRSRAVLSMALGFWARARTSLAPHPPFTPHPVPHAPMAPSGGQEAVQQLRGTLARMGYPA